MDCRFVSGWYDTKTVKQAMVITSYKDLNTTVVSALTEQYSNSRNFCDGDIYRSLRYCQLNGDKIGEGKWTARLWDTKLRDVIQLQNMAKKDPEMAKFQESLDALLPFAGLWPALQIGTFHRLLTLRCPEVSVIGRHTSLAKTGLRNYRIIYP